jgi:hypothetical protein
VPTYLAKNGKTFGPFGPEEIEDLKESGEFFKYEYFWDGTAPEWSRVPPPVPPPPMPGASAPKPAPQAAAAPAKQAASEPQVVMSSKQFQAVCHDFHRLLSGTARNVTSAGCELVSEQEGETSAFASGAKVWIDLLDEPTDRSVTLQVNVGVVKREGKHWVYQIQWKSNPLL